MGFGACPKFKNKKRGNLKIVDFRVFLLFYFFASVYTLAMLATVEPPPLLGGRFWFGSGQGAALLTEFWTTWEKINGK